MGVYFSCKYALVPQHLLHDSQVGSVFYKVSCKRVSEGMRRYLLAYTRNNCLFSNHYKDHLSAELSSSPVKKDCIFTSLVNLLELPQPQINLQGFCRRSPYRNQSLLAPFSCHLNKPFRQEKV